MGSRHAHSTRRSLASPSKRLRQRKLASKPRRTSRGALDDRRAGRGADQEWIQEIAALHVRLHAVYCTATCIQLALMHGLMGADHEVGACMEQQVVDELCEIGQGFDLLLVERGGEPQFLPIEARSEGESPLGDEKLP